MIQLTCALSSGFRSPFSSAARKPTIRLLPSRGKLASSRTHCGNRPFGQSAGKIARALDSSTSGKRGVRRRQTSSAFSTSPRASSGGRWETANRLGLLLSPSLYSGATQVILFLYRSGVGVRKLLIGKGRSIGTGFEAFFRNRLASFSCGTPTPSFHRLVEL